MQLATAGLTPAASATLAEATSPAGPTVTRMTTLPWTRPALAAQASALVLTGDMPASIWPGESVSATPGARACDHAGEADAAKRVAQAISSMGFIGIQEVSWRRRTVR